MHVRFRRSYITLWFPVLFITGIIVTNVMLSAHDDVTDIQQNPHLRYEEGEKSFSFEDLQNTGDGKIEYLKSAELPQHEQSYKKTVTTDPFVKTNILHKQNTNPFATQKSLYVIDNLRKDIPNDSAKINSYENIQNKCNLTRGPILDSEPQLFQRIQERKVYVFSAFAERRPLADGPSVRVIAAGYQAEYNTVGNMYCQMWFNDRNEPEIVRAKYKVIHQSTLHHEEWTAHFIICPLKTQVMPTTVSITSDQCSGATNQLFVLDPGIDGHIRYPNGDVESSTFGICLPPLYGDKTTLSGLAEMIELYTILGAKEIVFYNASMSPQVAKALRLYTTDKSKSITIVQWHIPRDMATINYFLQRVAINDCIYRLAQRHHFVAVHDIDEVFVPRKTKTLPELMKLIYEPKRAIYMFQHSYFRRNTSIETPYTVSQSSFWTTENVMPPGKIRCKSMYNAGLVVRADIHYHYELLKGSSEYMIPPDIARLHHYRLTPMETFRKNPNISFVEDRYMEIYKLDLLTNLRNFISRS